MEPTAIGIGPVHDLGRFMDGIYTLAAKLFHQSTKVVNFSTHTTHAYAKRPIKNTGLMDS